MAYAVGKLSEQVMRVEDAMAVVQTTLDHARIHRGEIWTYASGLAAMNDNASFVFHLKTAAGIDELHATLAAAGSGAGYVRIYEAPTLTVNGTELAFVNHMRVTARQVALASKLYYTPTTSANGTLLAEWYLGSGNKGAGTMDAREQEWVLKPNTSYLIIFESDAASNVMSIALTVYEK